MDPPASKDTHLCPNLQRCVERWGLMAPYSNSDDNEKWGAYYAERACLEFRHAHFWNKNGEECKHFEVCRGWKRDCETAKTVKGENGESDRCGNCNGFKDEEMKAFVEPTTEMKEAWTNEVQNDAILCSVYGQSFSDAPPKMHPHCLESYADECHDSKTTRGQYDDFLEQMRERVKETLVSSTVSEAVAEHMASGLFIRQCWACFEEPGSDADVRTVDFEARLYSPIGNGSSIDLTWHHHFRERMTVAPEKYCGLWCTLNTLEDATPFHPTVLGNWREYGDHCALAILDGDTDEKQVSKTFATLPRLKQLGETLFGEEAGKVSIHKTFGLLARASGAHAVRSEAGWLFVGMRKRYELYPGEESDEEETGNEDGPGCVIS